MGAFVIILGVVLMVIIHEAGHFVAAKAFGMKATEAFFGFGPRIWSMTRGETEYGVKAVPLGGYVRIIGMNPFEEVAPEDEDRTYRETPFWQKSIVVLAGIFSHFVVATALFFALAMVYGVAEVTTEVDGVSTILVNPSEVADDDRVVLDLESGDTIVAIDGVAVEAVIAVEQKAPGELTTVTVDRDGVLITLETTEVVELAPAFASGILVGDVLVSANGQPVESWEDFVDVASVNPGESAIIVVDRDGEQVVLETQFTARIVDGEATGFFGISPLGVVESVGPIAAAGTAFSNLWTAIGLSVRGLWDLVTNFGDLLGAAFGQDDEVLETVRPISPVGLVRIAGPVEVSLGLLALVNVFVGVLNFVPLYPLDGGHFAVAVYEKIRGRAPDVRKLMPVAAAVFLFIVMLGLLGIYFDIANPLQLPE